MVSGLVPKNQALLLLKGLHAIYEAVYVYISINTLVIICNRQIIIIIIVVWDSINNGNQVMTLFYPMKTKNCCVVQIKESHL